MSKRKIVVTSALPYANGDIHIGHLVEYLQTDFWVRFQKMRGHDCTYVCADDTHGTPIMIRARKEGRAPEDLIAEMHARHSRDFADFQIAFDNYYSTNSPENRAFCEDIYAKLDKGGALLREKVAQLWCPQCGMFLPDRFVKGTCPHCGKEEQYGDSCEACSATYSPADLKDAHCATCGCRALETRETEHILFDLAKFKEYLRGWLPDHTQADVANKLQEWFGEDQTLLPWDISRDAPYFGFEIPGYPGKYFYVWLDAPVGYLASLRNWCERNGRTFEGTWGDPATERYHFIGKDIVRFHCLFWPAMLHAAGYQGPTKVFVHGFLTVNGEKMSKSRGTFVSARTYLDHLDPAFLRYYYACKINNTTDDIDLNLDDFAQRVNADLVGKITNLASRGGQMLGKKLDGRLGSLDDEGRALLAAARERADAIAALYEARKFSQVPVEVCKLADAANEYFDRHAPWKAIKEDPEAVRPVLTTVLNLFRVLAIYLAPILPVYAKKAAALFREEPFTWESLGKTLENAPIGDYEYLATRVDPKAVEAMVEASKPPAPPAADPGKCAGARHAPQPDGASGKASPGKQSEAVCAVGGHTCPPKAVISIASFEPVDLRVGRVESCRPVEKSKKLVRFELDCGPLGHRTIFSGIRMAYPDPSVLDGKQVVFVANLAPREMKGVGVSEGMVLTAGDPATGLAVLTTLAPVNPGDPAT